MTLARHERATTDRASPVIVCITDIPEERSRIARLYDGVGVLVMAADTESASDFLGHLVPTPDASPPVLPAALTVDLEAHEARWHGRSLGLTVYELRVLACLVERPGRVLTYQQLHEQAWDGDFFAGSGAVQSVVKRLRAKLRRAGASLQVEAIRGVGFRLADSATLAPRP